MTTAETSGTRVLPSDQDATGRTLGAEEVAAVSAAISSGTLTSTKGNFVREFESAFAQKSGSDFGYACSSGTAAIHCAIAAIDPEPGDEIVTTAVTDMGALAPILYQSAVPVFADVDPETCNISAATIEPCLSSRTRAIIVTHLFGNPCDMDDILTLANERGIPVIEDCAQAFLTEYRGRFAGSMGRIGCFSLQQGKHITTGEGGIVVTDDARLARRMYLFINKAWGYGDTNPDHTFLALNYRMSELCGSVAGAQLGKLGAAVQRRRDLARRLTERLSGVPQVLAPEVYPGAVHSYWKYALRAGPQLPASAVLDMAAMLKERGIVAVPRYIQKPAFMCAVFRDRRTFGKSGFPFTHARPEALDYSPGRYPGTFAALERMLVIPWNDRYSGEDVEYIAEAIEDAVEALEPREVSA